MADNIDKLLDSESFAGIEKLLALDESKFDIISGSKAFETILDSQDQIDFFAQLRAIREELSSSPRIEAVLKESLVAYKESDLLGQSTKVALEDMYEIIEELNNQSLFNEIVNSEIYKLNPVNRIFNEEVELTESGEIAYAEYLIGQMKTSADLSETADEFAAQAFHAILESEEDFSLDTSPEDFIAKLHEYSEQDEQWKPWLDNFNERVLAHQEEIMAMNAANSVDSPAIDNEDPKADDPASMFKKESESYPPQPPHSYGGSKKKIKISAGLQNEVGLVIDGNQSFLSNDTVKELYDAVKTRVDLKEDLSIKLDNFQETSPGQYSFDILNKSDDSIKKTIKFDKHQATTNGYDKESFTVLVDIMVSMSNDPSKLELKGDFGENQAEAQQILEAAVLNYTSEQTLDDDEPAPPPHSPK